jgi:putative ABC transport system substrate-binding protein
VNIQAIRQFNPNFKKLGVLYNLNERNSVLKVEELRGLQENLGFELVALDLNHGLEAPPEIELIAKQMKALKKAEVDFIYVGSSSFLRRQHEIFTKEAIDNGIPVLSPYEELVRESNAILSVAARYYDVGRLAAKQVKRILIDGKKPSEIPVARISEFAYVINMQVARQLKLFPPLEFLQFAETIN